MRRVIKLGVRRYACTYAKPRMGRRIPGTGRDEVMAISLSLLMSPDVDIFISFKVLEQIVHAS
jgi:hypothetical protein